MEENKKIKMVVGLGEHKEREDIIARLREMYEVEIAVDSEEAYHKIHAFKPDLAILDFSLSKIHPIELYEGVSFHHAQVNFVLCVTDDNFEIAQRIWKQRSVDYIFKPFTTQQCVNSINTIVRNLINAREIITLQEEIKRLTEEIERLKDR